MNRIATIVGGFVAGGLLALLARRKSHGKLGDAADRGVLDVAADAFMMGDIKRGEEILDQLPEERRTLARCTRAKRKRYFKNSGYFKGSNWDQVSDYRLYKPLVAAPVIGDAGPIDHPYTRVTVGASRSVFPDKSVSDWVVVLGDLGPTAKYPDPRGETRYLVNEAQPVSHRATLNKLGYDVVVPCENQPLSGVDVGGRPGRRQRRA
jgi:hypothetical protein